MTRPFAALLAAPLLALLLPASLHAAPASGTGAAPSAQQTGIRRCPSDNFEQFLEQFSRQIRVQEAATADPLASSQVNTDAQPEPVVETRQIPLADVTWPVIPDLAQARRNGRLVRVAGQGLERVVSVASPDTSNQQHYHFRQQPCWTLVRVEDDSL